MSELRSMESPDEAPATDHTWFERIGESVGDLLAEPSAGHIIIGILVVVLILALALAYALG
jgi:hypothetical protein